MRRVVVTGIGVIAPGANNRHEFFENLLLGKSSIATIEWNDGPRHMSQVAGTVHFDPNEHFTKQEVGNLDRATQFAKMASADAIADAGLDLGDEDRTRIGVYIGTGMGGATSLEEAYVQLFRRDPERLKPLTILSVMSNAAASQIAIDHKLSGPCQTFSCACASSAVAIGEAYRQIKWGGCDVIFAGGAEALLTFGVFKAWTALRALAAVDPRNPSASCKPFSKDRSGLVLGEGAAIIVLEEIEHAVKRGARIYAELAGYGCATDCSHITKPSVEGQAQAMVLALRDADTAPEQIEYINAHGTATALNDVVETQAVKRVFGDAAQRIPMSSTKSMHGHLMGAGGAVEFAASLLAMEHQALPPTAHLEIPDPQCDLDYVPNAARRGVSVRTVMSNSFAFGGTNAVLVARALSG